MVMKHYPIFPREYYSETTFTLHLSHPSLEVPAVWRHVESETVYGWACRLRRKLFAYAKGADWRSKESESETGSR